MELGEKITAERKKKGITQQQLADITKLTARTIQRIENGQSIPRSFTINAIANALDTTFQALQQEVQQDNNSLDLQSGNDQRHFLQLLTLSCYSYLLIPVIHFLIPLFILKKTSLKDIQTIAVARRIIRTQVIWTVATNLLMLLTLALNFISAIYFDRILIINFLLPFFVMYALNAILLARELMKIRKAI